MKSLSDIIGMFDFLFDVFFSITAIVLVLHGEWVLALLCWIAANTHTALGMLRKQNAIRDRRWAERI